MNDVSQGEALRQQWKKAQHLTKEFWNRWIKEYLPTQVKRPKWQTLSKPIEVGDIVMIADESRKGSWEKGIITEIRVSKDGQVRSAVVKTHNGTFVRPTINMAVLDVKKPNQEDNKTENVNDSAFNKKSKKISRLGICMSVLITILFINMTNGLQVIPIEEDGIIFDHMGSCLVQRGVWKTQISSNIVPRDDISRINDMHTHLNDALKLIKKQL